MSKNLPICKLCKEKLANQTGAHIFSFFLIKGAVNEEGERKRDKEISFDISPTNFVNTYFGRSVSLEKIEEIKGIKLTDEERANNKNPHTIDNLVCRDCEKRFGTVETYFKDNVYDKLISNSFKEEIDKKGTAIKICEKVNSRMIRLFIYLHIWRAAAAKYNDWKIKSKEEEELRQILNYHLGATQKETLKIVEDSEVPISHFPLIVTYVETENGKESENSILIDRSKMPYCLIINDIIIQFFTKRSHVRGSINWIYGISDVIDKDEHANFKEGEFKIGKLNDTQRNKFVENSTKYLARKFVQKTTAMFSLLFQKCFGNKPTVEITQKVMNELINDGQPLGYKYTLNHVKEVFIQNILEIQEKLKRRQ